MAASCSAPAPQPNPKALETIELIRAMGTDIVVECGDIAEADTAQRLVTAATATGLPLRGVLHAAAVFEDATLANMTEELIERNWAPKVHGAWNLHQATAASPLDWFCLFSSAVALVGSPGQGAYAAANSWLDAFARWRRAQGLPATAIAWGSWAEVGRAAEVRAEAGDEMTPGRDGEGTAIAHWRDTASPQTRVPTRSRRCCATTAPYSGYATLTGTPWFAAYAQRSRFAELFRSNDQSASGTSELPTSCTRCRSEEWPVRLRRLVSDAVSLILRRTIDPDHALSEYGLDSHGQPRTAHPYRGRNGNPHHHRRYHHHSGLGGSPVRKAVVPRVVSAP